MQVGTLNYMSPEAILGGTNNIRGAPPMKVHDLFAPSALTVSTGLHWYAGLCQLGQCHAMLLSSSKSTLFVCTPLVL